MFSKAFSKAWHLFLFLLVAISILLSACGDIGPAPAEFPAEATVCNTLTLESPGIGKTQTYLFGNKNEWNEKRWYVFTDHYLHAGPCEE